jgi:NADPH-ferrihemoprotein reductase
MATYGEGEPTDNASMFVKYISDESTPRGALSHLSFSVFGLGNKQYEHFNRMGKRTNELLGNLGGNRIFEYGEGDDNECIEDDFQNWRTRMWTALVNKYHPDALAQAMIDVRKCDDGEEKTVELAFQVKYLDSGKAVALPANGFSSSQVVTSAKHFFTAVDARVTVNRELRKGDSRLNGSTRHLEISLEGTGINSASPCACVPLS